MERSIASSESIYWRHLTFDLFHTGHVELLEYCRWLAGEKGHVTVSLNSDHFVKEFKGKPPVMNYDERKDVLEACQYVDEVVLNIGGKDSKPAIIAVNPDVIVIGMDWLDKNYCEQMGFTTDWLNEHEITLAYVPRTRGVSTTRIKERI